MSRRLASRFGYALLGVWLALSNTVVHADAVTEWNEIMQALTDSMDPFAKIRTAAIAQLAVFEAVNAVTGDYESYLASTRPARGASAEAAAISAAHRALSMLAPGEATQLRAQRIASLRAIADGKSKVDGIAVGEAVADAILAVRAKDGSHTDASYTPGTNPGAWRPTPPDLHPAAFPSLGRVTPFVLRNGAQFPLQAPPDLLSDRYARDLDEVKRLGDRNRAERPAREADVARFYAVAEPVEIYFPAARQASAAQGKTLSQNARTFALLGIAIFDAAVACFEMKYRYNFWRPVTAIQAGEPHRPPDAAWQPLVYTPPFPSYPSGHATFGAAARRVLEHEFGLGGHSITLSNRGLPDVVLRYSSWKQITDDVDNARVFGGVHYRFDQRAGANLGRQIGDYVLKNALRPRR